MSRQIKIYLALVVSLCFLAFFSRPTSLQAQELADVHPQYESWQEDWGLPKGFALAVDTQGYTLPSSMAFVPEPGTAPDDPLYYVAELRGTIKVVTNDRSIHVFATDFLKEVYQRGLADIPDEFGLTGICLAPKQGFLFATVTHQTKEGSFNDILRFETEPIKFGLSSSNVTRVGQVFDGFKTNFSHVIGPCQVENDQLYVGVGDGYNIYDPPIGPEIPAGKVLRMDLDGNPLPDNPFYDETDPGNPAGYVWAYGFRNPFGLFVKGDKVFVGDNGNGMDRFLLAEKGQDYLWNGDDLSIGSKSLFAFSPTIGPTQLAYYPASQNFLSEKYQNSFFMGMAGTSRGIINIPYTERYGHQDATPEIFLNYLNTRNNGYAGTVAALAVGPDALYFAPIAVEHADKVNVLKIYYDPANEHPFRRDEYVDPTVIIDTKKCLQCHSMHGNGAGTAPDLTPRKLQERVNSVVNSPAYLDRLTAVDAIDNGITARYSAERQHLREVSGMERVWYWVYYRLQEPRFDNPQAAMPNLGLNEVQAASLADFLVGDLQDIQAQQTAAQTVTTAEENVPPTLMERLKAWRENLPPIGYRDLAFVFVLGGLLGAGTFWALVRKRISKH